LLASNSYSGGEEGCDVEVADLHNMILNGDEGSRFGGRTRVICWRSLFGEYSIMGILGSLSISESGDWDMELARFRNNGRGSNCLGWNGNVPNCKIAN